MRWTVSQKKWFRPPSASDLDRPKHKAPIHLNGFAGFAVNNEPGSTASVEEEVLQQVAEGDRNGRAGERGVRAKTGWQVRAPD